MRFGSTSTVVEPGAREGVEARPGPQTREQAGEVDGAGVDRTWQLVGRVVPVRPGQPTFVASRLRFVARPLSVVSAGDEDNGRPGVRRAARLAGPPAVGRPSGTKRACHPDDGCSDEPAEGGVMGGFAPGFHDALRRARSVFAPRKVAERPEVVHPAVAECPLDVWPGATEAIGR